MTSPPAKSLPQRKRGAGVHRATDADGQTLWIPAPALVQTGVRGMTGEQAREGCVTPTDRFPTELYTQSFVRVACSDREAVL
jgi:hypothetical protein